MPSGERVENVPSCQQGRGEGIDTARSPAAARVVAVGDGVCVFACARGNDKNEKGAATV